MARLRHPDEGPLGVLVAGAGIAGLETLVALRGLAAAEVAPTLIAPDEAFVLRALSVYEPFGFGAARRYELSDIVRALDVGRRQDEIARVDRERRTVVLDSGTAMAYDTLVLAIGAVPYPVFDYGILFAYARTPAPVDALLQDVRSGRASSVAVVAPEASGWSLPAYELAFMLASAGRVVSGAGARAARARNLSVTVVTAEPAPLAAFGAPAADMIRAELAAAEIELVCGVATRVPSDRIVELSTGGRIRASRIVHLPGLAGPRIAGIPCDPGGFIPVGDDLTVDDDPDVFAIGDGIAGAHKHGGLAAQQAEAVAQQIAHRAGAIEAPEPYRPALRAVVRTEHGPRYLRAMPPGGDGESVVSDEPLWWPPSKVASRRLVPWLATSDLDALSGPPTDPA